MIANTCYICHAPVGSHKYKAYDQTMCSQYCRDNLIKNFDYDYNFRLVRKYNYVKEETKIINPALPLQQNTCIHNIFNKMTFIKYIWRLIIFYCN